MAATSRILRQTRAAVLGLLALTVAACASSPAPVSHWPASPPMASYPDNTPPIDPYAPPRLVEDMPPLQCVPFARQASGIEIYGDANTWWSQAVGRYPQSNQPAPGAVLVLRGYNTNARGHVAVVTMLVTERIIRVDQANWMNRGEITLSVPVMDVSPNNDWSEVRVWHLPGQHWGGRVYQAEGFIHAFSMPAIS